MQAKYFILTRTLTKATVTADFSFLMFVLSNKCWWHLLYIGVGSHIHVVSSLGLFKGAQPLPQVLELNFLLCTPSPWHIAKAVCGHKLKEVK